MDVNAIRNGAGTPAAVASPVVSSAVPEQGESRKVPVIRRVEVDVVEFDRGSQVKATESPLIVNSNQNIRSGSHVFHDEATNQFVVQVVNKNNEVIRQLPGEDALRIAGRFRQVVGLIFDQRI
ncbi:MAG TPA: hypothetical protein EYN96_06070 [Candidatus Hydrogenedentes bacterium]|nr:hypothetical protein [Candidatus Hydrogenedentota bacterium]